MKLQIIFVLNKIFIKSLPPIKINIKFKSLYKFCNILIPGLAEQKIAGWAGNLGPVDTSNMKLVSVIFVFVELSNFNISTFYSLVECLHFYTLLDLRFRFRAYSRYLFFYFYSIYF